MMPDIEHDLARPWRNSEKGRISSTWMLEIFSLQKNGVSFTQPLLKVVGIRVTSIRLRSKDCEKLKKISNLESWPLDWKKASPIAVIQPFREYWLHMCLVWSHLAVWYSVSLFVAHLLALPVTFKWFSAICLWHEDIAECTSKCAVALSHYNLRVECYYFLTKAPITVCLHHALVTCNSTDPYRASWY